jgi:hypothetical protein
VLFGDDNIAHCLDRLFVLAQRDAKTKSGMYQLTGPYVIVERNMEQVVSEAAQEAIALYKENKMRMVRRTGWQGALQKLPSCVARAPTSGAGLRSERRK